MRVKWGRKGPGRREEKVDRDSDVTERSSHMHPKTEQRKFMGLD